MDEDHIQVSQTIIQELLGLLGEAWSDIDDLRGQVKSLQASAALPHGGDNSNGNLAYTGLADGVLIIDDSTVLQLRLKSSIESLGYSVLGVADNGQSGAELALALHPRLIIVDHQMPGTGGLDCVRAIRGQGLGSRVIVCSAHISPELEHAYSGLNVFDMLLKPIALDALVRVLHSAMGLERQGVA